MFPNKLKPSDEIRVIAPSGSLSRVRKDILEHALSYLESQGFKISFSKNSREMNEFMSSEIKSRVDDIHDAFADENVKMIFTCIGGFNVNQILPYLDYELIKANPKIIGGNLCTLNLLQGTPFMPDLKDKVLFIEDDNIMGNYFVYEFDRNLQSLLQVCGAESVKGIVFGRFNESCKLDKDMITKIIKDKVAPDIPVVFGVDFGHVFPMITYPIGGTVRIEATGSKVDIQILKH